MENGRKGGEAQINNACSFYHLLSAEIFETETVLSLSLSFYSLLTSSFDIHSSERGSLIDIVPITAARARQYQYITK